MVRAVGVSRPLTCNSYFDAKHQGWGENRGFRPTVEHSGPEFTIGDFLTFAGVVEREDDE